MFYVINFIGLFFGMNNIIFANIITVKYIIYFKKKNAWGPPSASLPPPGGVLPSRGAPFPGGALPGGAPPGGAPLPGAAPFPGGAPLGARPARGGGRGGPPPPAAGGGAGAGGAGGGGGRPPPLGRGGGGERGVPYPTPSPPI